MKTVNDNRGTKLGMEVLPRGVIKRKLNPNELGYKVFNSRNKKKCFICNTYDNITTEQVIVFGYRILSYVCIDCRNKEQIKK